MFDFMHIVYKRKWKRLFNPFTHSVNLQVTVALGIQYKEWINSYHGTEFKQMAIVLI